MLDVNKLTLGEVGTIERLSGLPINQLGDDNAPKGLLMAALAFVAKRREGDASFTWNDAQGLTLEEAGAIIGDDVAETVAGGPEATTDTAGPTRTTDAPKARRSGGGGRKPTPKKSTS